MSRMPMGLDPPGGSYTEGAEMSTSEMIKMRFGHDDSTSVNEIVTMELEELYKRNLRPLEKAYRFDKYREKPLSNSDFEAKPLVLVLGQGSTGKSTFIRNFLGRDFPRVQMGPDTSTNKFNVFCFDHQDQILSGHLAVTDEKLPFQDLKHFGNSFLNKFQVSKTNADVLKDMWFVDTPGITSAASRRSRGKTFQEAINWFARKATRIVLLFDPNNLEINTEFEQILTMCLDFPQKVRIVLNKANQLSHTELVKVYGTLMWNISSSIQTAKILRKVNQLMASSQLTCASDLKQIKQMDPAEEMKIYVSGFSNEASGFPGAQRPQDAFLADSEELMSELQTLPKEHAIQKMNDLRRRAMKVKLHARVMIALKERLPKYFGKKTAQMDIVQSMNEHLQEIAISLQVPYKRISYMNTRDNRDHIMIDKLAKYKNNAKKGFDRLDTMVNIGIPMLLNELNGGTDGLDIHKELMKHGLLKKGQGKKGNPKFKVNGTRGRSNSGTAYSVASTRSMFSVSSVKSKLTGAGKIFNRRSAKSRRQASRSQKSVISVMSDDARSSVSRNTKSKSRFWKKKKKNAGSTIESKVETEYDDHIDLFSVMSS